MDDESGGFVWLVSAVCSDGGELVLHGLSDEDVGVLEDGGGVAEDEVDGAVDLTATVELAIGVGVESVLVSLEAASEEDGFVGAHLYRHRLVPLRAGCVLKRHVSCPKAIPGYIYIYIYQ